MEVAAARVMPQQRVAPPAAPGCGPCETWARIGPAADAPQRLAGPWAALADAAEPNAFSELWFMRAGIANLAPPDLKMLEVWSGSGEEPQLLGLLPLRIASRYGRMPVRHVQNWLHFHSFLGSPLIRVGHERDFWTAVIKALDEEPWASGFLHLEGISEGGPVHRGLMEASRGMNRACDIVYRSQRALLASSLSAQAYFERTVRKKKRKELKRLAARLAELGKVEYRALASADELESWCDAFLALERAGWKGKAGSALACDRTTELFFRQAVAGGFAAGRLQMLRLDLDGQPIAMLVNLFAPPGSFSFKIAYDEEYARFSPGVLIQIENLRVLERSDTQWMDSCAVEDHPMINSLWGERRTVLRLTIPLAGFRRRLLFRLCRMAENASAAVRRMRSKGKEQDDG